MRRFDGLAEFVAGRLPALVRLARTLTDDPQCAEDLVQTALWKTARRWAHVTEPSAYVRRVMRHESISWWRRRQVDEQPLETVHHPVVEDPAERIARQELCRTALRRLTPRQRAVIVLRYYHDLTIKDTAGLLGCSTGTIKSHTFHALNRLRQLTPDPTLTAPHRAVAPAHAAR